MAYIKTTYGNTKKTIRYLQRTVLTIRDLYFFFKNTNKSWIRSSHIRNGLQEKGVIYTKGVKISNTLLWQLCAQGYLSVSPRMIKYLFEGKTRWVQSYYWKANLKRFEQCFREAKVSLERNIKRMKIVEHKPISYTSLDVLENPNRFFDYDDEDE